MIGIDELARLAREATPGEWRDIGYGGIQPIDGGSLVATTVTKGGCLPNYAANSAFIAAANPSALLELIGMLKATEHDRDRLTTLNAELAENLEASNLRANANAEMLRAVQDLNDKQALEIEALMVYESSLEEQRDDLLSALRAFVEDANNTGSFSKDTYDVAREAIAKAEGEQ